MAFDWRFALFGPGEFAAWSDGLFPSPGTVGVLSPGVSAGSSLREQARQRFLSIGVTPRWLNLDEPAPDLDFVYLQGGNPAVITDALAPSRAWRDLVAGSTPIAATSGGAMALGALTVDLTSPEGWRPGLNLLSRVLVAVHWDRLHAIAPNARTLYDAPPEGRPLLALNENAALVGDGTRWTTHGPGGAVVRVPGGPDISLLAGAVFDQPAL